MKILLIEDYRELKEAFAKLISDSGHECTAVESISEIRALGEQIKRGEFQVVILDNLVIGGECFPEIARWVRAQNKEVRIALNSGDLCPTLASELGALDLAKSVSKFIEFVKSL